MGTNPMNPSATPIGAVSTPMATSRTAKKYNPDIFVKWNTPRFDGSKAVVDTDTGLQMLHVDTWASLVQGIGYVKYKAQSSGARIFYRGQSKLWYDRTKLYKDADENYILAPSAFREKKRNEYTDNSIKRRNIFIEKRIVEIRKANPGSFGNITKYPNSVVEGLLQQYDGCTTWLDVVDNIWVALWFACWESQNTVGLSLPSDAPRSNSNRKFIHMVRRNPRTESPKERFAYILLLGGNLEKDMEMVDLRTSIPSYFLRPHAQHGVLIRAKPINPNMVSLLKGIIRIDLQNALEWLGHGISFDTCSIIPPPNLDTGYAQLLKSERKMSVNLRINFPIYC